MEPIKITDKLTLRQEALRMALERANAESHINDAVKLAKEYEEFLLGNAELPEYEDTHKDFKDMLGKFQESFAQPRSMWIPADDEMKPAKGIEVLCALQYGSKIEYALMTYDSEEKVWYGGADEDNTNHVVAWMPIPPYSPTL